MATCASAGIGALLTLLGDHADTRRSCLLHVILKNVVGDGGRHIEGCGRGRGSVDGEIEMSGSWGGKMVRTHETGCPLARRGYKVRVQGVLLHGRIEGELLVLRWGVERGH